MTLFGGIDVGTGGARCLIVDEHGNRAGYGATAWRYRAEDPGIVDVEPGAAADAIRDAVGRALSTCDPARLRAVGITSQRSGVAFLDEKGEELSVAPNADGRALMQGIEIQRAHGDQLYRINGRLPALLYLPARLAWFRDNRPEDVERIALALSLADWIAYRMTGIAATERTQAAEMQVYDVARDVWSDELLRAVGVPASILPPVLEEGTPAGEVTPEAAERFGLPAGCGVVPGGADTQASALAMGVTAPGQAAVVAGTTMIVQSVRADARPDPLGRMWLSPHHLAGRWVEEVHCGEAGAAVDWLCALLGVSPEDAAAEAEGAEPGAGGVAFIDSAPSSATNFPLMSRAGLTFPAPVLALGRSRADVLRALFEGVAFGAREALGWIVERDGPPASLAVAGGVAQAAVFPVALAGSAEQDVRVPTEPASACLGAAIVAATDHHGTLDAAVEAMADPGRTVAPDPGHRYVTHLETWRGHAAMLAAGTTHLGDVM